MLKEEYEQCKLCVGDVIEYHLMVQNKSRSWLARRLNVSTTTIGRWIRGESYPSLATWSHIKEELDIEERDPDPELMIPKEADFLPVEQISESDYLAAWLCPNCGEEVEWDGEDEETFCKHCGQRLTWIDKDFT